MNDRVRKLLYKDLHFYKTKNKVNRTSNKHEYIAQWLRHEYEQNYKSLESFSCVFKGLGKLE